MPSQPLQPVIVHEFTPPEARPAQFISLLFSALVLAPLLFLLWVRRRPNSPRPFSVYSVGTIRRPLFGGDSSAVSFNLLSAATCGFVSQAFGSIGGSLNLPTCGASALWAILFHSSLAGMIYLLVQVGLPPTHTAPGLRC